MRLSSAFFTTALPQAELLVKHGPKTIAVGASITWLQKDEEVFVAFDNREVQAGNLFIALRGEKVDGHSFIESTLRAGAVALLISNKSALDLVPTDLWRGQLVIVVSDTLQAFIALAIAWRSQLTMPIVAITGSVGKTTTKEIMRVILAAAEVECTVSLKNQNTTIGLCSTILNIKTSDKVAICEIGISLQGEMVSRVAILRPTIGVITNVGHMHAAGLGGSSGIVFEKRQIFKFFEANNVGIINGDQAALTDSYYSHPIAKFGFKTKNQVQARKIIVRPGPDGYLNTSFTLKWYGKRADVKLFGGHHGYVANALAASTVAYFLNIPFAAVIAGLEKYQGFADRFQFYALKASRGKLISDCYNAGPESMRAAIEVFGKMPAAGKKVAVIGDMLELGEKEVFWNRQVGRMIAKIGGIDEVILVGSLAAVAKNTLPFGTKVALASTWREAVPLLEQALGPEALVLVKGSRGVALKNLVEAFVA
jgi:UDP-N-acetylmuramoyl-tripeptide--D-alanyl-D-alanine ligase